MQTQHNTMKINYFFPRGDVMQQGLVRAANYSFEGRSGFGIFLYYKGFFGNLNDFFDFTAFFWGFFPKKCTGLFYPSGKFSSDLVALQM